MSDRQPELPLGEESGGPDALRTEAALQLDRRVEALMARRQPALPLRTVHQPPRDHQGRPMPRRPEQSRGRAWRIDESSRALSRSGLAAARAALANVAHRSLGEGANEDAA